MGITHQYNRARAFVHAQTGPAHQELLAICRSIQQAQSALQTRARPYLRHCRQCAGLCCRRIHIESIVHRPDFIFILTLMPHMQDTIQKCIQRGTAPHAADCPFLANGVGPCLFPATIRPMVCITAFCFETPKANRRIRALKRRFLTLQTWIWKQDMLARWHKLKKILS